MEKTLSSVIPEFASDKDGAYLESINGDINIRSLFGDWEEYGGEILMGINIYDFLVQVFSGKRGKFVGIITNRQVATIAEYNAGYAHNNLSEMLLKYIFPNISFDYGIDKTSIMVFGTMYSVDVALPFKFTCKQREALTEIINDIGRFEKDFKVKLPYFYKDGILNFTTYDIVSNVFDDRAEVLVGCPIVYGDNLEITVSKLK